MIEGDRVWRIQDRPRDSSLLTDADAEKSDEDPGEDRALERTKQRGYWYQYRARLGGLQNERSGLGGSELSRRGRPDSDREHEKPRKERKKNSDGGGGRRRSGQPPGSEVHNC